MHPEQPRKPERPEHSRSPANPRSSKHPGSPHASEMDPELQWNPELARFARQLAQRTPVASGIDPALPFYQAGYAAGMANQAAVNRATADKRRWGSLGLVASWLLLLGLGTAAGYLASWRHHGALLMAAHEELRSMRHEQQAVRTEKMRPADPQLEPPGSDMAWKVESDGDAEEHGIRDDKENSNDNRQRSASGWDAGNDWIRSRMLSWFPGTKERVGGDSSRQPSWVMAHGRSDWMERVMAQIHDPTSQFASFQSDGPPPGDRTGETVGRPESGSRPSRRLQMEMTQPTSLREVVERRTQFLESFLQ